MGAHRWKSTLAGMLAILLCLFCSSPVLAADNPDLLPNHPTPVIDLAKALSSNQLHSLEDSLNDYESKTGWKLRVLTQFERTPGVAVKDFWGLDERSLLVIADPRGGNLLNFNVGDALFALMPRTYWVELQSRFGNQYYVREHGEDGSILDALSAVETCLERGGCKVVPGLPREQWLWTLTTSVLGGLIAGFAAYPRKQGDLIAWPWLLMLSPLWVMLFAAFGLAPVLTRTQEFLPVFNNSMGFVGGAIGAYLIAQATFGDKLTKDSEA